MILLCQYLISVCSNLFVTPKTHPPQMLLEMYYYTPGSTMLLGGIFVSLRPSIRPSICPVRPASHVCSVAPTVLVGSIPYLYILSSNFRRCVTCKVSCKISKFEFLAIFFLICYFDLVLFWLDLIWITSMGNHGAMGGISECRHSSCSNIIQFHQHACTMQSSRMDFMLRLPNCTDRHQMLIILTNSTSDIWILRLTKQTCWRDFGKTVNYGTVAWQRLATV